jgi:alpha-beta hydrolase superfamily lysophospholipase
VNAEQNLERWEPSQSVTPRGTVIVIPGRGEHGGVYERLGRRLAFDGYVVLALSGGVMHDGDRSPDSDGLKAIVAEASGGAPRPLFLVGSDIGALEAIRLAGSAELGVAGVVAAGLPVAPLSQRVSEPGTWEDELALRTACPVHRKRISQDNAFMRGSLRPDLRLGVLADQVLVGQSQVPILAIHGQSDQVGSPAAVQSFVRQLPRAKVVFVREGLHDILNDAHHRSVAAAVVVFLERLRQQTGVEPILSGGDGNGERREQDLSLL